MPSSGMATPLHMHLVAVLYVAFRSTPCLRSRPDEPPIHRSTMFFQRTTDLTELWPQQDFAIFRHQSIKVLYFTLP